MKFLSKIVPVLTLFGWLIPGPSSGIAAIANVTVNNTSFAPAITNISPGDTVLWTWPSGSFNHNVHSTSTPQAWTASAIQSGPATFSVTFTNSGTFPYNCTVHGFSASVVVVTNNSPPAVTITNPVNGAVFIAPTTITIQASATDSNGSVTNVQFLVGTGIVSNVTTSPYLATTNLTIAGTYTLSAIAFDNLGAKSTNSISIIVSNNTPPSVSITNPLNGAVFSAPANLTIRASATDSDGSVTNVQFLVGSGIASNTPTAPFLATTNLVSAGSYTLTAIAVDNLGAKATNTLSISIVNPVAVALTNASAISGANFQFRYSANVGLSYVIQRSTNVAAGWISIVTNTAASNPVVFIDTHATNNGAFYRVGRMPNP
jgi:plastocyanin